LQQQVDISTKPEKKIIDVNCNIYIQRNVKQKIQKATRTINSHELILENKVRQNGLIEFDEDGSF